MLARSKTELVAWATPRVKRSGWVPAHLA